MNAAIFAYDFALQNAWAAHLEKLELSVNLNFQNKKKKLPFIDQIKYLAEPTGTRINHAGNKYWHVWRGPFSTRIATDRLLDNEDLVQLSGQIRLEAQLFHQNLNESGLLPYHLVNDMLETTPATGHFPELKLDWYELRWMVTVNIRPSAFLS